MSEIKRRKMFARIRRQISVALFLCVHLIVYFGRWRSISAQYSYVRQDFCSRLILCDSAYRGCICLDKLTWDNISKLLSICLSVLGCRCIRYHPHALIMSVISVLTLRSAVWHGFMAQSGAYLPVCRNYGSRDLCVGQSFYDGENRCWGHFIKRRQPRWPFLRACKSPVQQLVDC